MRSTWLALGLVLLSSLAVAAAVVNALNLSLGDLYQVERDDGEDVLIKRLPGEKKFSVSVVENTVRGVRVNLDEE